MIAVLLCSYFGASTLRAQSKASTNWYFGQRAGITFTSAGAVPLEGSRMVTNKGSATISNPATGELLFYTDGVTVWNRFHEVMPNGTGLMGDPTTSQSALIIPAPGRPSVYYLFNAAPASAPDALSRCLCLYYSVVDMRADDGRGDITKKNEFLLSDITEHLTGTLDCKGDGWWIITRSRLSRHFFSLHLTSSYLETSPVVSSVDGNQFDVRDAGQLQVSPDNRHVLMTSADGSSQLFDFDAESGRIAEGLSLFGANKMGEHYGAAFSPDGQRAYVSVTNANTDATTQIYQFDIGLPTARQIIASMEIVADLGATSSWVPLQLGPDGRIYVGIPGTNRLSIIERPNNRARLVEFRKESIQTAGIVRTGLPNIPTPLLFDQSDRFNVCALPRAAFSMPSSVCEGEPVVFVNRSTGRISSWDWSIEGGSPATSTERNPTRVTFSRAGTFTVRLIARSDFASDTTSSVITVLDRPTLVTDSLVIACPGQPIELNVSGAERYQWFPAGQVSNPTSARPTVQVRSTTLFTVIGTSATDCRDTATVLVRIPSADAGSDVTICAGASAQLRASGGVSYAWSPSTGLSDATSESPVAQPRSTITYTVAIRTGSCTIVDTVKVTVLDSLGVSIQGPTSGCRADTIVLSASAGTAFLWQGAGVLDPALPSTRVVIGDAPSSVRLRVGSGGCSAEDSVTITPLQRPMLSVQAGVRICSGQSVQLFANAAGSRLRWSPSIGLDVDSGSAVVASPKSSITYVVTATNELGCTVRDTIRVTVSPSPIINAGADLSVCAGAGKRLLASGFGDEFLWTPADGLSDPNILTPTAAPAVTTTYVLRSRIGDCEDFDSVTVFVSRLQVRLSGDTAACRGNRLQLRASGAWKYRWTPTTGLQDSTSAVQALTADTSITYYVTGVDALGCSMTQSLRISVRDTVPILLMAGSVTAEAGHDSVGVPVIVDVPPELLPLHIDEMRATLVQDASAFFPKFSDRGSLRTSIRGNSRLAHLRIENLDIISPRQRVTSIRGVVLAGQVLNAPLTWENVEWDAAKCPNVSTTPGVLFVTGCNILGRLIRSYARPTFSVRVNHRESVIELGIVAQMPGDYDAELVTSDGRTLFRRAMTIHADRGQNHTEVIDMSSFGSGAYYLRVVTPTEHSTIPVMWIP